MSLMDMLTQQLTGGALSHISGKIGADEATTSNAISTALPVLISALAKKTSDPAAAQQLHQAVSSEHDGGILDNVMGFLSGGQSGAGAGILGHILGDKRSAVENGLAQQTGLNSGAIGQLLELCAPLVMGALAKKQQQHGLDANGLSSFLGDQHEVIKAAAPGALNMVFNLLDANHDGSVIDDIGRIAGKFFGGKK